MPNRVQVVCGCGAELPRPVPRICPHCRCEIRGVRRSSSAAWLPVLIVLFMFGTLVGLVLWLGYYLD